MRRRHFWTQNAINAVDALRCKNTVGLIGAMLIGDDLPTLGEGKFETGAVVERWKMTADIADTPTDNWNQFAAGETQQECVDTLSRRFPSRHPGCTRVFAADGFIYVLKFPTPPRSHANSGRYYGYDPADANAMYPTGVAWIAAQELGIEDLEHAITSHGPLMTTRNPCTDKDFHNSDLVKVEHGSWTIYKRNSSRSQARRTRDTNVKNKLADERRIARCRADLDTATAGAYSLMRSRLPDAIEAVIKDTHGADLWELLALIVIHEKFLGVGKYRDCAAYHKLVDLYQKRPKELVAYPMDMKYANLPKITRQHQFFAKEQIAIRRLLARQGRAEAAKNRNVASVGLDTLDRDDTKMTGELVKS